MPGPTKAGAPSITRNEARGSIGFAREVKRHAASDTEPTVTVPPMFGMETVAVSLLHWDGWEWKEKRRETGYREQPLGKPRLRTPNMWFSPITSPVNIARVASLRWRHLPIHSTGEGRGVFSTSVSTRTAGTPALQRACVHVGVLPPVADSVRLHVYVWQGTDSTQGMV